MRAALFAILLVIIAQSAIVPLLAAEDCAVQEMQHPDDDCSPLCVTCACSPIGHAFKAELVSQITLASVPSPSPVVLNKTVPDAPSREIPHVPLSIS